MAPSNGFGDWDVVARSQPKLQGDALEHTATGSAVAIESRSSLASETWRRAFLVTNSILYTGMAEVYDQWSVAIDEPSRGLHRGLQSLDEFLQSWGPDGLYRSPSLRPGPRDRSEVSPGSSHDRAAASTNSSREQPASPSLKPREVCISPLHIYIHAHHLPKLTIAPNSPHPPYRSFSCGSSSRLSGVRTAVPTTTTQGTGAYSSIIWIPVRVRCPPLRCRATTTSRRHATNTLAGTIFRMIGSWISKA